MTDAELIAFLQRIPPAPLDGATGPTGPTGATGATGPSLWAESGTGSSTALSTDASTSLGAVTISGLDASSKYSIRYSMWVTVWKDATLTDSGVLACDIDAYVSTDASAVATVTFQSTPYFDTSLLPAGLIGASATVAASTGGFTLYATRVASTASHAIYFYGTLRRQKLA